MKAPLAPRILWILLAVFSLSYLGLSASADADEVARARAAMLKGASLIDVRTKGEFDSGHLDGATNIPVDALEGELAKVGPKDKAVVVYCASGRRSARAKKLLVDAGFKEVHDLGGIANGK